MKFSMKAGDINTLNNTIYYALNSLKNAPVGLGLKLAYNAGQLKTVIEAFEKQRKELLDRFGAKNEAGELLTNDAGNAVLLDREGFDKAFQELSGEVFEVELRELSVEIFPETLDAAIVAGLFPIIME